MPVHGPAWPQGRIAGPLARPGGTGAAAALLLAYGALYGAWQIFRWGGSDLETLIADFSFLPLGVAATAASFLAMRRSSCAARRAWFLIGLAVAAYCYGDLAWFRDEIMLALSPVPFPSLADAGYIAFYPLLLAGLLALPRERPENRGGALLDLAIVGVGTATVVWWVAIEPLLAGSDALGLDTVVAVTYPVGDMLVLFAVGAALMSRLTGTSRRALVLIGVGLFLNAAADIVYTRQSLEGTYVSGSWQDLCFVAGWVAMGLAGLAQARHTSEARASSAPPTATKPFTFPQYIAIGGVFLTLLVATESQGSDLRVLVAGSVIVSSLILARQSLTARENTRLVAAENVELKRLRSQARLVQGVTSRITANVSLDAILVDLTERAIEVFRADRAYVATYARDGRLQTRVSRGLSGAFTEAVATLPAASLGARAIAERRTLAAVDYANDPRGAGMRELVIAEGFDSIAVAPLIVGDEVLGMLVLYHDSPHPYSDDDLDAFGALADHASIAIRNARAISQLEKWTAQLTSIEDLGVRLSGLGTPAEIGEALIGELRRLVDCQHVRVFLIEGDDVVPIAWGDEKGEYAEETADQLRLRVGEGITGWVAAHGIAQYLPDAVKDPRGKTLPGTEDELDESLLVAPMTLDGRVTGVIVLSKLGLDQFQSDDMRLLEIFANLAAQAIANADATDVKLRASEARLRTIVESAYDAVITVDDRDQVVAWNPAAERMFGYTSEEVEGRSVALIGAEASRQPADPLVVRARAGEAGRTIESRVRRRDGQEFPIEYTLASWTLEGSSFVTAMVRDVTERQEAEAALRATEARYRALVETVPAVVYLAEPGPTGRFRYVSPQIEELLGFTAVEWMADAALWWSRIHPDDRERVRDDEQKTWGIREGEWCTVEYRMLARDGRPRWVRDDSTVIRTAGGEPEAWSGFLTDVTERKALEEQLTHQAFHDPLTGLANRVLFTDRLEHALTRNARSTRSLAVLFLDLDDFKTVNDSIGHAAGDELLHAVAGRLTSTLRPGDTAARFGGDEFAVLVEDLEHEDIATVVADRLLATLTAPFDVAGRRLHVNASIGIATRASAGQTAGDLLRNADTAMYAAKRLGKGHHQRYHPQMHVVALRRLEVEAGIRQALDHDEFTLHYQPTVRLADGAISGFEALVRWNHPEQGLLPPLEFIHFAEESGLISRLGEWVLGEACRQARVWQDTYPPDGVRTISVNVSATQLLDPSFCDVVRRALVETALDPGSVILELTESIVMDDSEATLGRLHQLKELGVRLAIDDFGTGYSSLSYLSKLPIDVLKIDKAFVDRVAEGGDALELVRVIVGIGRTFNLETVAEGVELPQQAAALQSIGCLHAQGYLFSRPKPPAEIALLLARSDPGLERAG